VALLRRAYAERKKLGILGLGRIGREVAVLAKAFGMQVLAWGPTLTAERAAKSGATFMELDALLQAADIVTVQLKLSDGSRGLLDERRLRLMRPHAVLINTARGAIADEAALARILQEGVIAGAGLDVFARTPRSAAWTTPCSLRTSAGRRTRPTARWPKAWFRSSRPTSTAATTRRSTRKL
jgi:phosphoglycerate dehydrogenase-like enzyme